MSWLVTLGGKTYSSLDLTLDEVEALERISGDPWVLLNPFAKVSAAKAYLAVFAIREGHTDEEVAKIVGSLTIGDLRDAFRYVDDEEPKAPPARKRKGKAAKAVDPTNAAHSSPPSSIGVPSDTDGHQPSRGVKK